VEEGILPGGGVALLRASSACKPKGLNHDEQTAYRIVQRACRASLTWIVENAGSDGSLVCEKVAEGTGNFGYNAATDVYQDLVAAGVIDQTKVVRCALATECFFERSGAMSERHPDLHQTLRDYYRQDPAARLRRMDR
jgi:chaperonin GroEL